MQEKRMEVADQQVLEYPGGLAAHITGALGHFVFNIDETGHQDWADCMDGFCIVSSACTDPFIDITVRRTRKWITVLACVATSGTYLRPGLAIARKNL
jgi:hypothetical protein